MKMNTNDLISRQAAIDAIRKDMYADKDYMSAMICDGIESVLRGLPSVQEQGKKLDEWCYGCREYDQERHCCPRWNRVIRNTVEELKAERWIPVTERPPEEDNCTGNGIQYSDEVLMTVVNAEDEEAIIDYGHTVNGEWYSDTTDCLIPNHWKVTAWLPLPEPYKERSDENH